HPSARRRCSRPVETCLGCRVVESWNQDVVLRDEELVGREDSYIDEDDNQARRSRRTLHEEAKEESVLLNPATPRGGVEPPDLLCRSPGHRSHTMTSQGYYGI